MKIAFHESFCARWHGTRAIKDGIAIAMKYRVEWRRAKWERETICRHNKTGMKLEREKYVQCTGEWKQPTVQLIFFYFDTIPSARRTRRDKLKA